MRVLFVWGYGMIGGAVVEAFAEEEPEVLNVSGSSDIAVDITIHDSVRALFDRVGPVDAVASSPARFLTSSSLAKQPCGTSPKASLLSPTARSVWCSRAARTSPTVARSLRPLACSLRTRSPAVLSPLRSTVGMRRSLTLQHSTYRAAFASTW
jgi:hypothetical protein